MNKNELITKLDLTFIITIFVGISYVLAYIHHIGMFAYYGIPFEFLDIDVKEVLYAMFTLLPLILGLIWGLIMKSETNKNEESLIKLFKKPFQERKSIKKERKQINKKLNKKSRNINTKIEKTQKIKKDNKISDRELLLGEDKFLQTESKANNKLIIEYLFILFLLLVFLGFIFLSIVFSFYYISTNNLQFIMILINSLIVPVVFYMKEKVNYKLLFIFILLFLIVYSFGNGWKTAQVKKEYITFNKNEETFIVLTTYKNQFLYASIDEGAQEINKEFSIIDMQEIDHFKVEKIKNED